MFVMEPFLLCAVFNCTLTLFFFNVLVTERCFKKNFLTKTLERKRSFRIGGRGGGWRRESTKIREVRGDFENSNLSCSTIGNKRFPVIICEMFYCLRLHLISSITILTGIASKTDFNFIIVSFPNANLLSFY